MELHSYAKRKASKKWTVLQKRKLVETRIACDSYFKNQRNSLLPWKKVLCLANLDDYNIFFVRKQWSNMVGKYKQYKQNRLGDKPTQVIDEDTIRKISEEWEFFYPIHRFMTGKTTNLHSYAQKMEEDDDDNELLTSSKDCPTENDTDGAHPSCGSAPRYQQYMKSEVELKPAAEKTTQRNNSASSTELLNDFSSDTTEDISSLIETSAAKRQQTESLATTMNTDHDFYTKPSNACNYFADVSEDTYESAIVELTTSGHQAPASVFNEVYVNSTTITASNLKPSAKPNVSQRPMRNLGASLSERDKYYRHKRRFHRRLEKRFDCMLNIFGQIVKAEYPSIDVGAILKATEASVKVVKNIFTSEDEETEAETRCGGEGDGVEGVIPSETVKTEQSHVEPSEMMQQPLPPKREEF